VYFFPREVLFWPSFLHVAPALTAALEIEGLTARAKETINMVAGVRFTF
jgi:hypothetical protein